MQFGSKLFQYRLWLLHPEMIRLSKGVSMEIRTARQSVLNCGTEWPETRVEGIGPGSIKCVKCGAEATPFTFTNGYTIVFDQAKSIGVTIGKSAAENIARHAARYAALPEGSVQNPILLFAPSDLVGLSTRLRPFLGQLGTTPSAAMPIRIMLVTLVPFWLALRISMPCQRKNWRVTRRMVTWTLLRSGQEQQSSAP